MNEAIKSIDQEIIRLYTEDDRESALRLFIKHYQTRLYSVVYQMLGNHDDAMDVLQEILLQINCSLKNFKGESSLYTWVYRLSANICLNFRKKRSLTNSPIELNESLLRTMLQPVERPNEDPDKMCETKYKQFMVQQAILKLPETQRMIIVLRDLEGVAIADIASILNINSNAAKSRLHRSRQALRTIISKGFAVEGMEGVGILPISFLNEN